MSNIDTTTLDGKIAVMTAFKEGRKVQYRNNPGFKGLPVEWTDIDPDHNWSFHGFDYRIKPLEFPPLPEGLEYWNPSGLTPEQVGDGRRLLVCGETIPAGAQYWGCDGWIETVNSPGLVVVNTFTYRTPSSTPFPEPPKPKVRVPLDCSEIPCGAIIHWTKAEAKVLVTSVNERSGNIYLGGATIPCPIQSLMDGEALISRDGGKTWGPCSKEA